jgi:hypothetical protein
VIAAAYFSLGVFGVYATAHAAKLPGGQTSVIILNKDAPTLDSRKAHIATSTKSDSLKQGKCSVTVSHATGLRLTGVM